MARKRKPGNREPNGKPSRRLADKQAQRTMKEQDAMHVVKSARQRVFGVSIADSGTELAGTVCGRLFLQGEIKRPQLDAALAFADTYHKYSRAMGLPRQPKAVAMGLPTSGSGRDETPEQYGRCKERWDEACKVIQDANSIYRYGALYAACDYLVLRDELHEHMLPSLKLALSALARHFGVDGRRVDA